MSGLTIFCVCWKILEAELQGGSFESDGLRVIRTELVRVVRVVTMGDVGMEKFVIILNHC